MSTLMPGDSRSSNWPDPTAQKNAATAPPSSNSPNGISKYRMSMAHSPTERCSRSELNTTISELNDMPIAAIQGSSMPLTANGIAVAL